MSNFVQHVPYLVPLVPPQMVAAGSVVCHPEWPVPLVARFAARVLVLEPPIPVLQGQQVVARFLLDLMPSAPAWTCSVRPLAATRTRPEWLRFVASSVTRERSEPHALLDGWRQVTLHAHSGHETGVISRLVSLLNSKTGEPSKQRPRCLLKVRSPRRQHIRASQLPRLIQCPSYAQGTACA